MIYTTHSMGEAERLCDRIAILDAGRVAAVGAAVELAAQAGIPGQDLEAVFLKLTGRRLRDDEA
jgi:ABC-2 type transport system ATP-binding protein